ncbi:MAG: serine/threonine-protein kinase [Gemmatimonadaceae bacterium]
MAATQLNSGVVGLQAALAGQYTLERELGRGGMGIVYLARDVKLDRPVAIKILPSGLAEQAETRERFLREARTAAHLSHPNIVPVFRADELDGHAFFVMAYVDGESLADRVRDRGPLPPVEAVRYLREVAWALAYAHARGVVHRDIKPENIMIERGSGRAVVTDFGIARAEHTAPITQDGYVLGTVHYMSPEQVSGDRLDGRSDLYSLGVVGFFALSGRLPFDGGAPSAILVAHATRPAPPLASVAPDVLRQIAAVIDRCLNKEPDARYATGEALADALGKAMTAAEAEAAMQSTGAQTVLTEGEAAALWRRAAQLQAEAAQRLEQRVRQPELLPSRTGPTPAEGYRLRDVEAAAVEAGISHQFVALALAEMPGADGRAVAPGELPDWQERAATRVLGSSERSLSVSRVIRAAPRRVLQAVGRVLQGYAFNLALRDTVGGHPLDGGILVFDIPGMTGTEGTGYRWTYTRYACYAKQVRVALHPIASDPGACEVVMYVDLRSSARINWKVSASMTGGFGGLGAAFGAAFGAKALALAGAAIALPAVGLGAVVAGGTVLGYAAMYRWGVRATAREFDRALRAVEADVRSEELFGSQPAHPLPPPRRDGGMPG